MGNGKKKNTDYVVVTTDKDRRGVFFGVLIDREGDFVVLEEAQMAVYWPEENHGVLGLASDGPKEGSRISPIVPRIELDGVTSIITATKEASERWKEQPWN